MALAIVPIPSPHGALFQTDVEHEPSVMTVLYQPDHLRGVGIEALPDTHTIYHMGMVRQLRSTPPEYRSGRHVVFRLHAHVVLVTKYRKGPITDRVRELLIETTREVCERHEVTLVEADGEVDHLHLLIDYPPKVPLSRLVGTIKTNTSKRVREQNWPEVRSALWGDHFWSPSYFVTSSGGAPLALVAEYVRNQRNPNKSPGRPKIVR